MYRRMLVLLLLLVGLALIVAPALIAVRALLQGDIDGAWRAFGPVLLIPLGFVIVGVVWPLRNRRSQESRRPPAD